MSCYTVSSECLCKAATEFPLLQELQIYFSNISSEGIKVVGRSCPLLKSFTFDKYGSISPIECDDEALAIAENMHGLHHLALFGNKITNKGVQAILDGCPHLESLDLRRCFNVTLEEGDLGVRCSQRIKNLRCPNDSTSDYEFCDYVDDDDDYYGSDGFPDYYDYDYDDYFAYDDYTDPFSHEYLEMDDDYSSIPLVRILTLWCLYNFLSLKISLNILFSYSCRHGWCRELNDDLPDTLDGCFLLVGWRG